VTSSIAVFEAATWVESMNEKIMIENQKKERKYGNQRNLT